MQKKEKPPIRKRSFLLFELLLAIALVSLCLFPLLKPHFAIQKEQQKELKQMQLSKIASGAFCEIKKRIYSDKDWDWEKFSKKISGILPESEPVYLSMNKSRTYQPRYVIKKKQKAPKIEGGLLLQVDIYFDEGRETNSFSRTLFIQKKRAGP
ncbi:MAG: hypothetical protein WAM28_06125 [Chlamydiales bacterium]